MFHVNFSLYKYNILSNRVVYSISFSDCLCYNKILLKILNWETRFKIIIEVRTFQWKYMYHHVVMCGIPVLEMVNFSEELPAYTIYD